MEVIEFTMFVNIKKLTKKNRNNLPCSENDRISLKNIQTSQEWHQRRFAPSHSVAQCEKKNGKENPCGVFNVFFFSIAFRYTFSNSFFPK